MTGHRALPRALARFNKRVTNRIQGQWAWLLPPYAVIVHRGRRSGKTFRTPVMASVGDGRVTIAVMYGTKSDWVRNLLAAGGGEIVRRGRTYELLDPVIIDRTGPDSGHDGRQARLLGGVSGWLLQARLGARLQNRSPRGFPAGSEG